MRAFQDTKGKKISKIIIVLLGIFLVIGIGSIAFLFLRCEKTATRIGIVVVGTPSYVISYDPYRKNASVVVIPEDVHFHATHGYGTYRVSALWALDGMEKRHGALFMETLEETLGIPIHYYISSKHSVYKDLSQVLGEFSFYRMVQSIGELKKTNMSFPLFMLTAAGIRELDTNALTVFDLSNGTTFVKEQLPDGTSVSVIDEARFTYTIGTHFEDARIRKENLKLTVFNTTGVAGLGQNVARLLETAGFLVVNVGNDESGKQGRCLVTAPREEKESVTVKSLVWLYGCDYKEGAGEGQSEVRFFIGTAYQDRFLPYGKK